MANTSNLKPFTNASDPRRQNGRKKGSKNTTTLARQLLEEDVDINLLSDKYIKTYLANNSSTTYWKAVILAMIIKAINGDVRAATWVADRYNREPSPEDLFQRPKIVFNVVPNRTDTNRDLE